MKVLKKLFPLSSALSKSTVGFIIGIILHVVIVAVALVLAIAAPAVVTTITGFVGMILELILSMLMLIGISTILTGILNVIIWIVCLGLGALVALYFTAGLVMLIIFFAKKDKAPVSEPVDVKAEATEESAE